MDDPCYLSGGGSFYVRTDKFGFSAAVFRQRPVGDLHGLLHADSAYFVGDTVVVAGSALAKKVEEEVLDAAVDMYAAVVVVF